MDLQDYLLQAIYFVLPAYAANMAPVIVGKLNLPLAKPISSKYFGSHKTFRGFYAAYFFALAALTLQSYLYSKGMLLDISLINYQNINLFFYAFLFGIGALTGDLLKSFVKQKLKRKSGSIFFPWDQLDFIFGALLFVAPFYWPPTEVILAAIIVTPILHILTNVVAYSLKLKKVWW